MASFGMAQPPDGPPRGDGPGPGGPPLVRALDTDRDGEISAEEIAKASESLKSLDKNDDGKLTEDELRPPRPARRGPGGPEGRDEFRRPGGPPDERYRRREGDRDEDAPRRGPRGRDDFGPPRGPRWGFGPPGPGGPGPHMAIRLREELDLSDEQVKQLDALHEEMRARFEKILTAEQLEKFKRHAPPGPPRRGPDDE